MKTSRPSRSEILRSFLTRLALAGLLLSGLAVTAAPAVAEVERHDLRLRADTVGEGFALPLFRIYDGDGRLVMDYDGYDSDFPLLLEEILDAPRPLDSPHRLEQELATFEGPDGGPLPELPQADLVLIKYFADWCIPCHAQTRDLEEVLADERPLRLLLLEVSADHIEL